MPLHFKVLNEWPHHRQTCWKCQLKLVRLKVQRSRSKGRIYDKCTRVANKQSDDISAADVTSND